MPVHPTAVLILPALRVSLTDAEPCHVAVVSRAQHVNQGHLGCFTAIGRAISLPIIYRFWKDPVTFPVTSKLWVLKFRSNWTRIAEAGLR